MSCITLLENNYNTDVLFLINHGGVRTVIVQYKLYIMNMEAIYWQLQLLTDTYLVERKRISISL